MYLTKAFSLLFEKVNALKEALVVIDDRTWEEITRPVSDDAPYEKQLVSIIARMLDMVPNGYTGAAKLVTLVRNPQPLKELGGRINPTPKSDFSDVGIPIINSDMCFELGKVLLELSELLEDSNIRKLLNNQTGLLERLNGKRKILKQRVQRYQSRQQAQQAFDEYPAEITEILTAIDEAIAVEDVTQLKYYQDLYFQSEEANFLSVYIMLSTKVYEATAELFKEPGFESQILVPVALDPSVLEALETTWREKKQAISNVLESVSVIESFLDAADDDIVSNAESFENMRLSLQAYIEHGSNLSEPQNPLANEQPNGVFVSVYQCRQVVNEHRLQLESENRQLVALRQTVAAMGYGPVMLADQDKAALLNALSYRMNVPENEQNKRVLKLLNDILSQGEYLSEQWFFNRWSYQFSQYTQDADVSDAAVVVQLIDDKISYNQWLLGETDALGEMLYLEQTEHHTLFDIETLGVDFWQSDVDADKAKQYRYELQSYQHIKINYLFQEREHQLAQLAYDYITLVNKIHSIENSASTNETLEYIDICFGELQQKYNAIKEIDKSICLLLSEIVDTNKRQSMQQIFDNKKHLIDKVEEKLDGLKSRIQLLYDNHQADNASNVHIADVPLDDIAVTDDVNDSICSSLMFGAIQAAKNVSLVLIAMAIGVVVGVGTMFVASQLLTPVAGIAVGIGAGVAATAISSTALLSFFNQDPKPDSSENLEKLHTLDVQPGLT